MVSVTHLLGGSCWHRNFRLFHEISLGVDILLNTCISSAVACTILFNSYPVYRVYMSDNIMNHLDLLTLLLILIYSAFEYMGNERQDG